MTTNAQITRAIKKATGFSGVRVSSLGGCCHFYCDDNYDLGMAIVDFDSVMVCYINHQTAEQWTADFIYEAKEKGLIE